jgi:fluoroacetyl-CoA thioesterase
MSPALFPGVTYMQSLCLQEARPAPSLCKTFPGLVDAPPAFAAAFVVGFIESACSAALAPYLDADERSVGVRIDLSCCTAARASEPLTVIVELVGVDGPTLRFKVVCRNRFARVAEGFHERVVVQTAIAPRVRQGAAA